MIYHLLRLVTLPHLANHRLRTTLSVIGVALGVATVVAIADVSDSVLASFQHMVRTVAGDTELEVTGGPAGIDEELIARVATVPGVADAAGIIETFVPLADRPDENLYLLGIDFLGSPVWQTQFPRNVIDIADELEFLSRPDSVLVSRRFAAREHLDLGGELRIVTPSGARALRVRGLLGDAPPARLFDGALVVMDLPAAELLLGRERRVDRIAIQLGPGAPLAAVEEAIQTAVGDGFRVGSPEGRGEQTDQLWLCLRIMLASMSLAAVIVGAFIVYHTVAVSVTQRRREFALLNAVGVGRRALVRLCLVEATMLGVLGLILGLLGGRQLGRMAASGVGETISAFWVRIDVGQRTHSQWATIGGIGVGLGVALAAAYVAIQATFRAATVETLRPAGLATDDARKLLRPAIAASLLLGGTWLIVFAPPGLGFTTTVAMLETLQGAAFAGGALFAPVLVAVVGLGASRLARWSPSLPARLAADNLPRSPGRSGATVATITAAMGIAIMLACLVESFESAYLGWIEQHFAADLFVGRGTRVRIIAGPPIAPDVAEAIARIPGVSSVEPFRVVSMRMGDRPVFLQGISVPDRLIHGGLPMVEGNFNAAAPALEAGTGVLLSDNLAFRLGLHRGDEVSVPTPAGMRRFRIEGTFVDYLGSLDLGAVAVAHTQLASVWNDHLANLLRVWLAPGAAPGSVRAAILARLGPGSGTYVVTAHDFRDGVRAVLDQFFGSAWALELVAALVGVIGVVNAQVATVLDRTTEIAMLRTIGVSLRDLTRSVLLECGALGLIGGVSGAALGAMLGAEIVLVALRLITGWRIGFVMPIWPLVGSVALAALISAFAGYVPARAAARLSTGRESTD